MPTITHATYRDYRVEYQFTRAGRQEWWFSHPDWDLGDPRTGSGRSLEDCIEQIDDIERERSARRG